MCNSRSSEHVHFHIRSQPCRSAPTMLALSWSTCGRHLCRPWRPTLLGGTTLRSRSSGRFCRTDRRLAPVGRYPPQRRCAGHSVFDSEYHKFRAAGRERRISIPNPRQLERGVESGVEQRDGVLTDCSEKYDGNISGGRYDFDGTIDEVVLFNSALDVAVIAGRYAEGGSLSGRGVRGDRAA
jgi:hypothetical protein